MSEERNRCTAHGMRQYKTNMNFRRSQTGSSCLWSENENFNQMQNQSYLNGSKSTVSFREEDIIPMKK